MFVIRHEDSAEAAGAGLVVDQLTVAALTEGALRARPITEIFPDG